MARFSKGVRAYQRVKNLRVNVEVKRKEERSAYTARERWSGRNLKKHFPKKEEKVRKLRSTNGLDDLNPCQPETPSRLIFSELILGGGRQELLKRLKKSFELEERTEDAEECFDIFLAALGKEQFGLEGFELADEPKGYLRIKQKEKKEEEEKMTARVKKQVKAARAKVVVGKDGNPWSPGFGAYTVVELLRAGGTFEALLQKAKAEFKKGKIKSDPTSRLKRAIYVIDAQIEPNSRLFKMVRRGKGKNQVLKAVRRGK